MVAGTVKRNEWATYLQVPKFSWKENVDRMGHLGEHSKEAKALSKIFSSHTDTVNRFVLSRI